MLERYKDFISKAKSAKLETLTAWYSFFHMKEDPFLSPIPSEDLEYFVDREDVVDSIIYDVGVASRGIPITTLIVGPHGTGKTATLQHVVNILTRLKQEYPNEYSFNGKLFSSHSLFQEPEELEEKSEEVQLWVRACKHKRDYVFIDDAKPAHVKAIIRNFTHTPFKIFAISPLDYEDVYSSLPVAPKTQFLHPFDFESTTKMLNKRIGRALIDRGSEVSIFDFFDEEALRIIHKYAMKVPALILRCASQSLNLLQAHMSSNMIGKLKVTPEIATKACRITKCFHACTEFENISRTKTEVLQQVLKGGKTPTEISSILRRDRTTISRHLGDLRDSGLVEFRTRGRESVYEATEAIKIRFEIEHVHSLMPKGGWDLASA